jgi:hypothetical protein
VATEVTRRGEGTGHGEWREAATNEMRVIAIGPTRDTSLLLSSSRLRIPASSALSHPDRSIFLSPLTPYFLDEDSR